MRTFCRRSFRRKEKAEERCNALEDNLLMIPSENTHTALRVERLREPHMPVATMPTLRAVTQGCGISLRLPTQAYEQARQLVAQSGINPALYAIYLVDSNKNVMVLSQ